VDNNTKLRLQVENKHEDHGGFAGPLPKEYIDPQSSNVFGAQKDGGAFLTGVECSITYVNDSYGPWPIRFRLHFDNPYLGSNSASAIRLGPGCDPLFTAVATAGSGNEKAAMLFTISHNLGKFRIRNRATNMDLDVVGKSHNQQEKIQQYNPGPDDALNQQWRLAPVDGRYYHIYNEESGLVMDIAGSTRATGYGILQQFPLNEPGNRDNQLWQLIPKNNIQLATPFLREYFLIKNKATGMVLDVPDGRTDTNVVQQFRENQPMQDNQLWYLIPA
jgi:hypothetical protein